MERLVRYTTPSGLATAGTAGSLPTLTTYAEIGRDFETNEPVRLGDIERRSGLYILGRSGTGKTSLLVRLIEQDIKNGHGIFFLDPHGHGIEDIKARCDLSGRETDILSFDPQDEKFAFGINLGEGLWVKLRLRQRAG
jgi:DNA helicase HerA-like ATPase